MLTIGRRYLNFWPVFWALFLLVIQVVTNLWLPTITADIINKGIGQSDMKYIWFMGLIMLSFLWPVGFRQLVMFILLPNNLKDWA